MNRLKFLESHEFRLLMDRCKLSSRDDVLILLALETGARATELLSITQSDLFHDTQSVFIKGLKGSNSREIPLRDDLFRAVSTFIPFGFSYRRLDQIWHKYGIPKKFHSLRHTFAINLYRRTKDIKLLQLALGHKSLTSTTIYTDFVYSHDEMRRIVHNPNTLYN